MQDQGSTATVHARIALRVAAVLRHSARPTPFRLAGRALAMGLATGGGPPAAVADAMEAALVLVALRSEREPDEQVRLELAACALVLARVRPRLARVAGAAADGWLAGLGSPSASGSAAALCLRALFALRADDREAATEAVFALQRHAECPLGAVLHDWTVARIQRHGALREAQCFDHLVLVAGPDDALTLLLAAEVAGRRGGLSAGDARRVPRLRWPTAVPVSPRQGGTNAALGAATAVAPR